MYRSDSRIEIDGEDINGSTSCVFILEEHIGAAPQSNILRGLKTGLSVLTIMALVNTVPTGEAVARDNAAPSAVIEKGVGQITYQVFAEALEDRMSDDEFSKAMAALENIWNTCPEDLPRDLSARHDQYLFGTKG